MNCYAYKKGSINITHTFNLFIRKRCRTNAARYSYKLVQQQGSTNKPEDCNMQ